MICGRLPLLLVGLVMLPSCGGSPVSPSDSPTTPPGLSTSISMGSVSLRATGATFWRDWMPIVQNPGPDGGSALMATIDITVESTGAANRFTLTTPAIRDSSGKNYPTTVSAIETASGGAWDGTAPANTRFQIHITLREGPYLAVDSQVFAVLTWTDQAGRVASMRTADGHIRATM